MTFTRTAVSITGNVTINSTSVTSVSSTTQLFIGMAVYGAQIQSDTVITAIAGATVTLSKGAISTLAGATITGQYVTQTGTDTDPTGIASMTGVTAIDVGTGTTRRTVYNLGTNQLRVRGTFTHDPDLFEMVFTVQNGLLIESGGTYNLGVARTLNNQTQHSKGTGLVFAYVGAVASQFGLNIRGGSLVWNGGVVKTSCPLYLESGTLVSNSYDSVLQNTNPGTDMQVRCLVPPTFNAITLSGISYAFLQFLNNGWNSASVKYEFCAYQTPGGGGAARVVINPIFTGNQSTSDVKLNQLTGTQQITTIKNADRFPVVTRLNNGAKGDIPIVQTLTLNMVDSTNAAAPNVVGYVKDSNNGSRVDSSVSSYVADRTYIGVSDASGTIAMGDILTAVVQDVAASQTAINYDYRSNFAGQSADFNIYLGGYSYAPAVTRQTLMGNNGTSVRWTLFDDSNVTLPRAKALTKLASSFAIDPVLKKITVTADSTLDDLYDVAKAYKYQGSIEAFETPTVFSQIVTANGSNISLPSGWTLQVNNGATLSTGTKFTYVYADTVTTIGSITSVYGSLAGVSTIWEFQNVQAGATLAVWDSTGATKLFVSNAAAGSHRLYIAPGSTGTYYYAVEKYGTRRESGDFPASNGGLLWYVPSFTEDVGISEQSLTTVQGYTNIDTLDKLYDSIAAYRLTEAGVKMGNIAERAGTALDIASFSLRVNQAAPSNIAIASGIITIRSTSLANGSKYTLVTATPPNTVEGVTNEIITADIEDGNGNSSVSLNGGDGTFELWKVPNTTSVDDYATGTLLGTVSNGKFRFLSQPGFAIVGRDITSNIRRRVLMDKGVYQMAFYVGEQIQLAQQPEVLTILERVQVLQVDVESVKGNGFTAANDSLHILSNKINDVTDLTAAGL